MRLGAAVVGAMVFLGGVVATSRADAALTSSEKAQLRDFVASAKIENAGRVRTLVARTDHTESESIAALVEAVSPVPWTPERAALVKEVVFGGASAPSRPLLAVAAVRALLARADAVYQKYVGGLDHEPRALGELVAIYAFLDGEIANAGRPTMASHDAHAGIPAASYEAASKAVRDHVEQNQRWLKGDGAIPEAAGRVRAQAQVLLVDMLPDGTTRRVDAADRLALKGARRQMLTEWGVLFADAGKLDDAKVERVRQVLARLPGARLDLSIVYAGEDRGPLRARGYVAFVGAPGADAYPFADEVAAGPHDPASSAIALDLSVLAARRALDNKPDLRLQCERDAIAAQQDPKKLLGRPRGPGVDQVIGAAIHVLEIDAPRAMDLALARLLDGRRESTALLSDALGALAVFSPAQIELGKPGGSVAATSAKTGPGGAIASFVLDGHSWTIERPAPTFAVDKVTRDAAPISLASLPTARPPLKEGTTWSDSGYVFTKMRGTPQAAIAPGPTVKMIGVAGRGYDAIATPPAAEDFVLEGDLAVGGGPGGIAVRAVQGRDAVRGALLVVTPGGRTVLATSDDAGNESLLGAPIDPTPAMPVHVKITVQGTKIEAVVGDRTIKGTLPATLAKGDVAVIAKRGATIEIGGFVIRKK